MNPWDSHIDKIEKHRFAIVLWTMSDGDVGKSDVGLGAPGTGGDDSNSLGTFFAGG